MRHHGFSRSSLYKVTSEQAPRNLLIDSVEEYGSGNNSNIRAICIWFDGGERKEGSFSLDTLVIAQD